MEVKVAEWLTVQNRKLTSELNWNSLCRFCMNAFGKGMNSYLLPPAMVLIKQSTVTFNFGLAYSFEREQLRMQDWERQQEITSMKKVENAK